MLYLLVLYSLQPEDCLGLLQCSDWLVDKTLVKSLGREEYIGVPFYKWELRYRLAQDSSQSIEEYGKLKFHWLVEAGAGNVSESNKTISS